MKKFLIKICSFGVVFFLTLFMSLQILSHLLNKQSDENMLYVWGDSQIHQGIDFGKLNSELNNSIRTNSHHGAGVYDFLLFAEYVPNNSKVLVAFSRPALLRLKEKDWNGNGFSIRSLYKCLKNDFTLNDINEIFQKNTRIKRVFNSESILYSFSDSINKSILLENYLKGINDSPTYITSKKNLYLNGLKLLKEKECSISIISFPYHLDLENAVENSDQYKGLTLFYEEVINLIEPEIIDTISLNYDKEVMYDYTHLNEYGAGQVSDFLINDISNDLRKVFVVKNTRD